MHMKKRLLAAAMAFIVIVSSTVAYAAERRASDYLAGYGIYLVAEGNGVMRTRFDVDGTGMMTKIGAQALFIEYKDGNDWKPYETKYGALNPDFYGYNTVGYAGYAYFNGTPGVEYRVTLQAYAGNSTGSDTGTITSFPETCK